MDEPKDILACPFCGTFALPLEVSRTANAANYQQWCHHCGALGPKRESVETAHEAWNRRAGGLERRTTACSQSCSIDWMDAGDKLATAIEGIRMILYGLSLDLRQAIIAQRAIDKAKDALASWREKKASNGGSTATRRGLELVPRRGNHERGKRHTDRTHSSLPPTEAQRKDV